MNQAIISNFVSQTVPKFLEKKSDKIIYFGDDNLFPYDIIDLYNDSSTHNAIINGKIGYVVGQGLYSEDPRAQQWLDSASLNSDWTAILKNIAADYELFNGYAIEVKMIARAKMTVIVEDNNGKYWLMGQTNGVRLVSSESGTGAALGDRNGYSLSFQGQEFDNAPEVDPTVIAGLAI